MTGVADPAVEPRFASAALLTIDTQLDTLDGGALEIVGTSAVLPEIRSLCAAFRAAARPRERRRARAAARDARASARPRVGTPRRD